MKLSLRLRAILTHDETIELKNINCSLLVGAGNDQLLSKGKL